MQTVSEMEPQQQEETKRKFLLNKRDGALARCLIPEDFTVEQAKGILAERAGYEPNIAGDPSSVRLAVETETGRRLLADEMRFRDLEEGLTLTAIPSLAPARQD
jgi:hypothetical protein